MRIGIFGRTKMLYETAVKLSQSGHSVVIVGTCRESPEYTVNIDDFRILASKLESGFFVSSTLNSVEIVEKIRSSNVDIGISVNWLTVVGEKAISACKRGILNAHCGDLPRYKGNACPNWAIINGEKRIGLSIHFMEPHSLDSGDIVLKDFFNISDNTYIGDIYNWMELRIPDMFLEAVDRIANQAVIPIKQDKSPINSLRCYPRMPEDSRIDWRENADSICKLIRASSEPFAGAFTLLNKKKVIIWRAKVGELPCPSCFIPGQILSKHKDSGEIIVGTGGNGALVINKVQMEGKQEISPYNMVRSVRSRFT